jgi:putative ABC transport system substrate-binding protein
LELSQPVPLHALGVRRSSESSRKLGYVEGRNVTFINRFADNNYDRLPALADELVRLKVDVIITPGSNDTRAARNATKTIPIVFLGAGSDPIALGLVDSLARLAATSRGSAI